MRETRTLRRRRPVAVLLLSVAMVLGLAVPFALSAASAVTAPAVTFTWASLTKMPFGTTEGESVVLGGKLYMFGGFDATKACCTPTSRALRYDPATDSWVFLAAMPEHGISHAGIDSDGTRYIYYIGGYAADATATGQVYGTKHGYRYDTVTNTYSRLPDLPQERAAGGLAYVGGKLYYFGGANTARTYDAVEVWSLDVAAGATSWVSRAPLPNGRNHLGWGVIGGKIYAAGGQHGTSGSDPQADLDVYDPATNAWRVLAPMPVARSHEMDSTFVMGGKLVVAGGWTNVVSGAVTAYDPATNTWQSWSDLPEKRTSTSVRPLSSTKIFYCCGSAGTSAQTGWIGTRQGSTLPSLHMDFTTATGPLAAGYVRDSGAAYSSTTGFGWENQSTGAPLSMTGNTRVRSSTLSPDVRYDTLLQMQQTAYSTTGTATPGRWEHALPNGTYTVTVGVGDAAATNSVYTITAERGTSNAVTVLSAATPTSGQRFFTRSARVTVSDGRLTLDAIGGSNGKIDFVDVVPAA